MLEDLLARQSQTLAESEILNSSQSKRNRSIGRPTYPVLLEIFSDLHQRLKASNVDPTKIEVEVRVGMLVLGDRRWQSIIDRGEVCVVDDSLRNMYRLNFKAGMDDIMADRLKRILIAEGFRAENKPLCRQRGNIQKDRWELDLNGTTIKNVENKSKFFNFDIALLSCNYDIRVDTASEIPSNSTKNEIDYDKWIIERNKRRSTFTLPQRSPNQAIYWHIDLTEVETIIRDKIGSKKEFELEIELSSSATSQWLRADVNTIMPLTQAIASELFHLLELCIPSHKSDDSSGADKDRAKDSPIIKCTENPIIITQYINNCNQNILRSNNNLNNNNNSSNNNNNISFIGSMPLNLNRKSLDSIQRDKYFLTEKSDGVRYLLYVVGDADAKPQTILVDRAKQFMKLNGSSLLGAALRPGTVLDGELVYNRSTKRTVFLVFDLLALDGAPQTQLTFEHRYHLALRTLLPRLSQLYDTTATGSGSGGNPPSLLPPSPSTMTGIYLKEFFPKGNIGVLLSRLVFERGERVYRDRTALHYRHHKSDGIIFQPNTAYQTQTDTGLLKWKWSELCSVDLQVGPPNEDGVLSLLCSGPERVLIDCTKRGKERVGLGLFDSLRLQADVQDNISKISIAEVAYRPELGIWTYLHLRKDKKEPNYVDTVLGVFIELAEAISIEELEYRLLARSEAENDFTHQMNQMKRKALDFQRARTRPAAAGGGSTGSTLSHSSSSSQRPNSKP